MSHLLSWLPQTKLQPPRVREDSLLRPRLLALVSAAIRSHKLTLVAAPAGYGKTSLLSSWVDEQRRHEEGVAWLALDPSDDEPLIFFTGLLNALEHARPGCGATVRAALQSHAGSPPTLLRLIGLLINDLLLAPDAPSVLVLDDLHALTDPTIFQALDYLLEHLPETLHLVIITREDPPLALPRLRSRQQLAEIRLPDLRFLPDEAEALVNDQLKAALDQAEVRALTTHTEGWVAGLRLLVGSLIGRAASERAAIIERLVASDRHIFDLLAVEVLDRQPAMLRRFLLETSILDELTPTRCAAVTLSPDAALMLAEIEHRNLFLVALGGGTEPSYRYHALFAEFLRHRLALEYPAELPLLHQRAAASLPPEQAIAHCLAANAWDEAAAAIRAADSAFCAWGMVDRIRGWVLAIPAANRAAHPWLDYYLGACDWNQSRFVSARAHLERALTRFDQQGDRAGYGETLALLGTLHQTAGRFEQADKLFRQALGCPLSYRSQAQIHMGLAWMAIGAGDDMEVGANLAAALQVAETSGDAGAIQIIAIQLREIFCYSTVGRTMVERACQLANYPVDPTQRDMLTASILSLRSTLCLLEGHIGRAVEYTNAALSINERLGRLQWLEDSLCYFAIYTYHLGGKSLAAAQVADMLRANLDVLPGWYAARALALGYTLLDRGEIAQVRALEADVAARQHPDEWPAARCARHIFRGLVALHERQYGRAEEALRAAQSLQQSNSQCFMLGDVNVILAAVYLRWQRPEQARRVLQQALGRWRETGLPGLHLLFGPSLLIPVLEYAIDQQIEVAWARAILDLLHTSAAPAAVTIPETGNVLTPREGEVLRLLAQGASNKAIATTLVVSMPTVKTHVARLLGKLGVESRTAAAARARELGLV